MYSIDQIETALTAFRNNFSHILGGVPRLAVVGASYDPIREAEVSYKLHKSFGTLDGGVHLWRDLGMLVNQVDFLIATTTCFCPVFFSREPKKRGNSIITVYDSSDMTYERFLVKNEATFLESDSKEKLVQRLNESSTRDPVFNTIVKYYKFKPKK